ncbi:MAG: type III pantothenate kinase [Methylococcales bacterium]|nr:type III pantothenate kinase [Methylococcales bacterium]
MNILIDIGNSRLKWAMQQDGVLHPQAALAYRQTDAIGALQQVWQNLTPDAPQKIGVSSVADPAVRREVIALAAALWPAAQCRVPTATASGFGVRNAYRQPEKLGVDRWLALLAAHRHYPGACCIVDCGTAITLDMLAADGRHQGGLICPGLQIMKKSLSAGTAALAYDSQARTPALASDTAAAIDSGVRYAAIGMMETVLAGQQPPCRLILTGGDAPGLSPYLRQPHVVDAELVFKGLDIILTET